MSATVYKHADESLKIKTKHPKQGVRVNQSNKKKKRRKEKMKTRVQRLYYEYLEEIIEDLSDRIDEIKSSETFTEYEKDKITALTKLCATLDDIY